MTGSQGAENLDPRQLRYVLAVEEMRSFRRAAAYLAVPPGVLSREIAVIESQCGAILFDRLPQTAEATRAGAELAGLARRALALHVQRNADLTDGLSLRVGWVDFGRGQAIQRAALAEFRAQYPRIAVQVAPTPFRDQLRDLREGVLNAGFFAGAVPVVPGLAVEVLLRDTIGCAMLPSGHRLAQRELLAVSELSGLPYHSLHSDYAPDIAAATLEAVSRAGWRGRRTAGSPQPSEIVTTVACGGAWSPAPLDLAGWPPPGVELRPLADGPLLRIDLHALWREDDAVAGAFTVLACQLRNAIAAAVPPPGARPAERPSSHAEREMQDALLQDIIGSELQLEVLRRRLPAGLEDEGRALQQVMERLENAARRGRQALERPQGP